MHQENAAAGSGPLRLRLRAALRCHEYPVHSQPARQYTDHAECPAGHKEQYTARTRAWTLGSLYDYLSSFLFEVYDTIEHPALGQSPREAYWAGLQNAGFRPNRLIPYDQEFLIATLPATPKGTAKVSPGRGIRLNRVYYWTEAFRDPAVENQDVAVRCDPFDIGTAYAFVKNAWAECHSEHYMVLKDRSEKEVMLASKEICRRSQLHSQQRFTVTAHKLAAFLESAEVEEKCLVQRLRDRESKSIRLDGPGVVSSGTFERAGTTESPDGNAKPRQAEATAIYGEF